MQAACPSTAAASRWSVQDLNAKTVVISRSDCPQPQPADWRRQLVQLLETMPGVVAVGAKRLDHEGCIFSMGEFVIHPKGFFHLGCGVSGDAYRFPQEVDAICGGVMVVSRSTFDQVAEDHPLDGPLAMLQLCLALRAAGGRIVTVPQAVVTDTCSPLTDTSITRQHHDAFRERWGFDWRAADLDVVRARHAGSGLLWNVRYGASALPFAKYDHRPCMHWKSYDEVEVYRRRADHLTKIVVEVAARGPLPARVIDLGCGDGLFTHLLAKSGVTVIGIDPQHIAIAQAVEKVHQQPRRIYPGDVPLFQAGQGESLAFDDDSVAVVMMLDVIEHLPNPVAVLRQAARVLVPGGTLVISTPAWQYGQWSDPVYHVCEYNLHELLQQMQAAAPSLKIQQTGHIGGAYRDLIIIAQKEKTH